MDTSKNSALDKEDFIHYLNVNKFRIEGLNERYDLCDLKDDLSDDEICELLYQKIPTEYVGNATLVKAFCKEYKVVNLIDIIDMYVNYNDLSFSQGLRILYSIINGEENMDEYVLKLIDDFYENPIKLNNLFYLVKER